MSKVSVIIPNYNHAPYLEDRINSVLNQSYTSFDVIILDDCSTDDSRSIIEKYRNHPKVSHIIYNGRNSGTTFKQWEKGLGIASGEYVWIAESDDVADSSFLEKLMTLISQNDAVVAFSRSMLIDMNGQNLREKDEIIIGREVLSGDDFIFNHLLYRNSIYNASMVVFRKDAVDNAVWSEITRFHFCGDWLFWAKLISTQAVAESKDILNYYRVHQSNVSSKAERTGLTLLEGFRISKKISKKFTLKNAEFARQWCNIWAVYSKHYSFSIQTNLKILRMFLFQEPLVVFFALKQKVKYLKR